MESGGYQAFISVKSTFFRKGVPVLHFIKELHSALKNYWRGILGIRILTGYDWSYFTLSINAFAAFSTLIFKYHRKFKRDNLHPLRRA